MSEGARDYRRLQVQSQADQKEDNAREVRIPARLLAQARAFPTPEPGQFIPIFKADADWNFRQMSESAGFQRTRYFDSGADAEVAEILARPRPTDREIRLARAGAMMETVPGGNLPPSAFIAPATISGVMKPPTFQRMSFD